MPTSRRRCATSTTRRGRRTPAWSRRRSRSKTLQLRTGKWAMSRQTSQDVRQMSQDVPSSDSRTVDARGIRTEPDARSLLPGPRATSDVPCGGSAVLPDAVRAGSLPRPDGEASRRRARATSRRSKTPLFGAGRSDATVCDATDILGRLGTSAPSAWSVCLGRLAGAWGAKPAAGGLRGDRRWAVTVTERPLRVTVLTGVSRRQGHPVSRLARRFLADGLSVLTHSFT